MIENALPGRFLAVGGILEGEALEEAFLTAYPNAHLRRWFVDCPIHHADETWVVSNQWGTRSEPALTALVGLVPIQASSSSTLDFWLQANLEKSVDTPSTTSP